MYKLFKVGEKEYKLRLGAGQIKQVERQLGFNMLDIFMQIDSGRLPKLGDMLIILQGAMQKYEHGITSEKVEAIYDAFIDEGNTYMDLVPIITDVFKQSGLIGGGEDDSKVVDLGKQGKKK